MSDPWGVGRPSSPVADGNPAPAPSPRRPPRRPPGDDGGTPTLPVGGALAAALMQQSEAADQGQQAQAQASPGMRRMTTPPPAQPAGNDVWVTVPVDKVSVAGGRGTVTPVYATAEGYRSPAQGNAIPPTTTTGSRG